MPSRVRIPPTSYPDFGRGIITGIHNLAKTRGHDLYLAPSRARVTFAHPSCLQSDINTYADFKSGRTYITRSFLKVRQRTLENPTGALLGKRAAGAHGLLLHEHGLLRRHHARTHAAAGHPGGHLRES